jgi:hypothetical protein
MQSPFVHRRRRRVVRCLFFVDWFWNSAFGLGNVAAGAGLAPTQAPSKGAVLRLDDPANWPAIRSFSEGWWPASVTLRVQRLAGRNSARGRIRTRTGDVLNVVPLWWPRANAWATRAQNWSPHPEWTAQVLQFRCPRETFASRIAVHRTGSHTKGVHRSKCFGGLDIGVPDRLRSGDLLLERQACWLGYTTGIGACARPLGARVR